MRGRAIAVLSLLLLSSWPAFGQCSFSRTYGAAYRASYLDLAVDGGDLWAATSYGVQLYERAFDPPQLVASLALPGVTRIVRPVGGGTAYVGSGSDIVVVRRPATSNGRALEVVRSVDAGGTVNDLLLYGTYLFAATSNGIAQFQLFDPMNPTKTAATFATSSANVTSLAVRDTILYAADGDSSVERFTLSQPATPAAVNAFTSLPRSVSVKSSNGRLYISNGNVTEVFLGDTSAATIPFGTTSFAQITGDEVYVAGDDRRFHALDLTVPGNPVELFESELSPTGGTINRVMALQTFGGRVYVAAGDLGLVTYNSISFGRPYPVRGYSGNATSVIVSGSSVYTANATGGITEYSITNTGSLNTVRTFGGTTPLVVHDVVNGFLLTSSGATANYWALSATTPTPLRTVSFARPIVSAALIGTVGYLVLDDSSFWRVDLSASVPAVQRVTLTTNLVPTFVVRDGNALFLGGATANGTTEIDYYPTVQSTPQTLVIQGVPAGNVAVKNGVAAVFTFQGLTLIDFNAGGRVTIVPNSSSPIARGLAFSGTKLLVMNDRGVDVWNLATQRIEKTIALPSPGTAIVSNDTVAVATTESGLAAVSPNATTNVPTPIATSSGNTYYRKIVAGTDRIYLFDGRGIGIFSTARTNAPDHLGTINAAGTLDLAALGDRLFTTAANGTVTAYSRDGAVVAQRALSEGNDVQAQSLFVAGNALWLSISKGCLTGGCEKTTLVLDPQSLVITDRLAGGTIDVRTSGTTAFAIFNLPNTIRTYNIADPLHPSVLAQRDLEGNATTIDAANNVVYALGDKLYAYAQSNLAKAGEFTITGSADVAQKLRIDGNCAAITGRTFDPLFFTAGTWTTSTTPFRLPAAVRSIAQQAGRIFVLTDYSLEVLSTGTAPSPTRRRATE